MRLVWRYLCASPLTIAVVRDFPFKHINETVIQNRLLIVLFPNNSISSDCRPRNVWQTQWYYGNFPPAMRTSISSNRCHQPNTTAKITSPSHFISARLCLLSRNRLYEVSHWMVIKRTIPFKRIKRYQSYEINGSFNIFYFKGSTMCKNCVWVFRFWHHT